VVALAPDVTEMVFALGCGHRVVAVAPTADHPPQVRTVPTVNPDDVESILAHRPDLVIATTAGNNPRVVERLRHLEIPVFTVDVTSFQRLQEAVVLLGDVLNVPPQARELSLRLARETDAASRSSRDPAVGALYVVWWEPLMVAAPGTVHHDLLRRSGLSNLAPGGAGRYPRLQPEILLDRRLLVVVTVDETDVTAGLERLSRTPPGRRLASGEIRLVALPADEASRPGPRLPQALHRLSSALAMQPAASGTP
jgi:iron complex transport system substrate-binding protein